MNQVTQAWNSEPSRIECDQRYILAIAISFVNGIIVTTNSWKTIKVYDLKGNLIKTVKIRETAWNLEFSLNDNCLIAECYNILIVIKVRTWSCQVINYNGTNKGFSKLHNRLPFNFRALWNQVIQDQYFPKIKIIRKIKCTQEQQFLNKLSVYEQNLIIAGAQLSLIQIDSLKALWNYYNQELQQYASLIQINQDTNEFIYQYQDTLNNKYLVELRALSDGKIKKEILQDLTQVIDSQILQICQKGEYILTATMDGDIDIWLNDVKIRQLKYETGNQNLTQTIGYKLIEWYFQQTKRFFQQTLWNLLKYIKYNDVNKLLQVSNKNYT